LLAESLALALIGGLLGGLAAYLAFNGYQTSTMNFQTFSQVAFAFAVTRSLLIQGLSYALVMGIGGRVAAGDQGGTPADCDRAAGAIGS